jgi:hypothetical protein
MCPREGCGKNDAITAIHDKSMIHICSNCGESWITQLRGDKRYLDEVVIDFGCTAKAMTIKAGKRQVKLKPLEKEHMKPITIESLLANE